MKPASARAKGRTGEYQAAKILKGKRAPLSGGISGTGDVLPGDPWRGWLIEVKRRKKLPNLLVEALRQAQVSIAIGDPRKPLVMYREDGGKWMMACYAEDMSQFVEALAETGNAWKIKDLAKRISALGDEVRRLAG